MLFGRAVLVGVALLWFFCFNSSAQSFPSITTNSAGIVGLAWKPSPSPEATGYYLCWGLASGQCTNRLDAGSVTNVSLVGLEAGTPYFFNVVAYSSYGDEAPPSNEINYTVPVVGRPPGPSGTTLTMQMVTDDPKAPTVGLNFTAVSGRTYEVQATSDFQTWTTVLTTNSVEGGPIAFTEPKLTTPGGRFFRVVDY